MAWSGLGAKFRKLFSSRSTSLQSDRRLADEIGAGEEFTRFIFARKHFAAERGRVKPQALMPAHNAQRNRWETSVHRIAHLTATQIWKVGYDHVEKQGRVIKARGEGAFTLVRAEGLLLDVNGPPRPRHVDIIDWSDEKDVRMMKATQIADKLRLELDPRS